MSGTNSVYNKTSRYVAGGTTEVGQALEWWERRKFELANDDVFYTVDDAFKHRLDLIAAYLYDDTSLWWLIAQFNNIIDPFDEVIVGRVLRAPSKDRVALITSARTGGVESSRLPISNSIFPIT